MELNHTPFCIAETRQLDCQFGPRYYKERQRKGSRLLVQGSRKTGCHAHITIKKCIYYPDYQIEPGSKNTRTYREGKLSDLKAAIQKGNTVATKTAYFVSLPTVEAHNGVSEEVATKIAELVGEGITDIHEVGKFLRHYVMHDLFKDSPPDPNDRAYFPIASDLRNHIYMAKKALQLSCLNQDNLRLKIEQWESTDPDSIHYFRPYLLKSDICASPSLPDEPAESAKQMSNDDTPPTDDSNCYEQNILWIHQSKWQQHLLERYGNTISLIDATYKTTKYDLALFFICVKTKLM